METTPGITPVGTPESVEFCQHLALPMQRALQLGSPDSWKDDSEVHNALVNLHGKASESAERLARITQDLTVTSPVRHENAAKLAGQLIEAADGTAVLLERRAKEYQAAASEILATRFTPDPARNPIYMRCTDWIARQAQNPDNGYTEIRKAIDDDPDFALTMHNTNWRLLGLPEEQAMKFKERIVEKYAPDAMNYIDRGLKLAQLAKRYPAFSAKVKASFYSPFEYAKVQSRYVA